MDKKILVVDQSEKDAERFSKWLGREGGETILCSSSAAIEKLLYNGIEHFTVAIVCWEFHEGTTGAALLTRLKKLRPEMPVVISSIQTTRELAGNAKKLGANECF